MIHIQVPATSANMGPGFDSIGVALELYNHLWVEEIESGLEIIVKREQAIPIPQDETNLIYQVIKEFFEKLGKPLPGLRLIQEDFIPMVRGLGSSAACIVGGLLAANTLAGNPYDLEELAQIAAQLEGHPDNSNPALFGNMVVGAQTTETMGYVCLPLPKDLSFAIMVPDFPVSTKDAREVLPDSYTRGDMVFNASRAALLVASIMTNKLENLSMAMEDKVHQPFREKLIPHMGDIFTKAKSFGAKATYLSGAGSTLMAVITVDTKEEFKKQMNAYLKTLPDNWELTILKPDTVGATVTQE